jgi:outer membrane protein W
MYTAERTRARLHSRGVALRGLAAAAAGVVLCLAAGFAQAQSGKGDYIGRWSVSGGLGYAIPNTDEYGNSLAWRFGVGYSPIPQFEIGLELGRFTSAVSQPEPDGVPNHDIASGQLEVLPLCLAVQYHIPLAHTMATFNLLAGAGYYFTDYTMADEPRASFVSSGVEGLPDQAVSDTWGFHAGAGLEYTLSSWFSVTVEGRYVFLAPEVSGTAAAGNQLGGSLDLNTWLFTGGIKVSF